MEPMNSGKKAAARLRAPLSARFLLLPVAVASLHVEGGSFSVVDADRNGTMRGTSVESPEAARPQGVLVQAARSSEIEDVRPTAFYLVGATNAVFGPFGWDERTEVRIGATLLQVSGAGDDSLSLRDPQSGRIFGPFATTNGALVTLPSTNLTLERTPSFVRGKLLHKALAVKNVTVALVPVTPANRKPLTRLAAAFLRLKHQYSVDTAAVRYRMPTVRIQNAKVYEPIFEPSDRDIERARKKADMGAKGAFKEFLDSSKVSMATCASGQRFAFQNLAPGEYVVCALADVRRDPDSRGVPPGVVVWWADFGVRRYLATELKFDAESARDWQDLFQVSR